MNWTWRSAPLLFVLMVCLATARMLAPAPPSVSVASRTTTTTAAYYIALQDGTPGCYIVQRGDTLGAIGLRMGTPWGALARANHIPNPNLIFPGQRVCGLTQAPPPGPNPTPLVINTVGEFCHGGALFPAVIGQWTIPLGCYAGVYHPNPANYPYRPGFGWCNWWPEVLHPYLSGYMALHLPAHGTPIPGAIVRFAPGVQGASFAGHYGEVVAVQGYWILISEMNDSWRGAGFGRVNYRYVHIAPGVSFLY